jgi:hypothetical protein
MTTTIKTQAEAINELRNAVIEFETTGALNDELKTRVNYSLHDIQVRDFLMGITFEGHSTELIASLIEYLATDVEMHYGAPLFAVLGAYRYRLGNTKGASECLDTATQHDPNYSLTTLLKRVIGSGWPAGAFDSMTMELHPKVVEGIEQGGELEISLDK